MALITTDLGDLAFIGLQPAAPLTETLGWYTDVITTYNGGEERLRLRERPRQDIKATYVANNFQSQDVFNTVYGSLVRRWAIPLWGDAQYAGTLLEGATGAPVGNASAEIVAGGLVLLWGLAGAYALATVADVTSSTVTFAALPATIRSAYVVPIKIGRIATPRKQTSGFNTKWTIPYSADDYSAADTDGVPEEGSPTQYLGDDIYFDPGLITGDVLDEDIKTEMATNDYDLGVVKVSTPWTYPRSMRDYAVQTSTPADLWALKRWLYRRAGKYRPFWQPTFENDLRIADEGTVGSTLTVNRDSWDTLGSARTHLAIETDTGWLTRHVLTSSVVDDTVQLGLDSPLAVDAGVVKRISYLALRRLDTDKVDLDYMAGVCSTSFRVTELNP